MPASFFNEQKHWRRRKHKGGAPEANVRITEATCAQRRAPVPLRLKARVAWR
jgi:hypothetical protein